MNVKLWIMSQFDAKVDLKINLGHNDLYFTIDFVL